MLLMTLLCQYLEVIHLNDRLAKLYNEGRITQEMLRNAITKGWITEFEYVEIVGGN